MSKYLEKLFEIYLNLKKKEKFPEIQGNYEMFLELIKDKKNLLGGEIKEPEFEIGELYFVDNFIFLLIGKFEDFYTGYKVSEWVEFATEKDFIFEFNNEKYVAIMDKLYIPKEKLGTFLGKISEKYINILFEYETNDTPIPEEYIGLTVPENAIQYKFREIELKEVMHYKIAQFIALEEAIMKEDKILSLNEFKKEFANSLQNIQFPAAAHTDLITASTSQFRLHYNASKGLLTLILKEKYKTPGVIKIKVFDSVYLFYAENNIISIDVNVDYINVNYLAEHMEIIE